MEESFIEKHKLVLVARHASALMHRSEIRAMPETEKPPAKLGNVYALLDCHFITDNLSENTLIFLIKYIEEYYYNFG